MRKVVTILAALLIAGCLPATRDQAGKLPKDVVCGFISAVQVNDLEKAASYFTKCSLNDIQHTLSYEYSFEKYCEYFKDLDAVELGPAARGKAGYWHLTMSGKRGSTEVRYMFGLERVGDKWFLVETPISFFWDEPTPTEPHASVVVATYRLETDRNGFPPTAGPNDTTVLVHRIGHERVASSRPLFTDSSGAIHFRVRPGRYVVEYEVIKGKRDSQDIAYPVTECVFEAGNTYVLKGRSITVRPTESKEPSRENGGLRLSF